jgi:hypothetical protein
MLRKIGIYTRIETHSSSTHGQTMDVTYSCKTNTIRIITDADERVWRKKKGG